MIKIKHFDSPLQWRFSYIALCQLLPILLQILHLLSCFFRVLQLQGSSAFSCLLLPPSAFWLLQPPSAFCLLQPPSAFCLLQISSAFFRFLQPSWFFSLHGSSTFRNLLSTGVFRVFFQFPLVLWDLQSSGFFRVAQGSSGWWRLEAFRVPRGSSGFSIIALIC